MIHRDLQERNMMLSSRIRWGEDTHKPSFWPDDIVPWAHFSNPVCPQKYKLPFSCTEILKIAVYRCLTAKGIDPREYVSEDVCKKQIKKKLMARSMKTLDEAYQRFYSMFLYKSEPEEVKLAPDESFEHEDYQQAAGESEVTEGESFDYSDGDIMSDEDEEEGNGAGDDRAAAISNILNILAND